MLEPRAAEPRRAAPRRDAEIDEKGALARGDDDVVLALEIRVRDAGRVHRVQRREQLREERGAVRKRGSCSRSDGPGTYSSARYSPSIKPNVRGTPGDAREPRIDRVLAPQ